MNQDELLLLFSFLIYWLILAVLTNKSKNKKRTFIINFTIHLIYSSYMLHGLLYKSQGGTALAWWFYLLLIIWTHLLINLGHLFYLRNKNDKQK